MTEKQDRFSHAMEQCRQAYRDIPTPPELEGAVEDAIQAGCRPRRAAGPGCPAGD